MGQNCTYECKFSEILQDIDKDPLDIVCRKREQHLMYSTAQYFKDCQMAVFRAYINNPIIKLYTVYNVLVDYRTIVHSSLFH